MFLHYELKITAYYMDYYTRLKIYDMSDYASEYGKLIFDHKTFVSQS